MMLVNDIFLTGLGASLGGGIAGSFFGSFFQAYYSDKNAQEDTHLSDLKMSVIEPLIKIISIFDFKLSNLISAGFNYEENGGVQSDDVLFRDLMENHYPDIQSEFNTFVKLSLDMGNKTHNLLNKLKGNLSNTFHSLRQSEFQNVNFDAVETLAEGILNDYNNSSLRITDYPGTRFLYCYNIENPTVVFSDTKKYVIFSSAVDEETNIKTVNEVKCIIAKTLAAIKEQYLNELREHLNPVVMCVKREARIARYPHVYPQLYNRLAAG